VLAGVLFDLDGTLLDIDLDPFLRDYLGALGPFVAESVGSDISASQAIEAVMAGTSVMSRPHPGRTNREVFNAEFRRMTGADLSLAENELALERFYEDVFPGLGGELRGFDGAVAAVEAALDLDLRVAIATNPIFPLSAVKERMRWAGLDSLEVHAITSYEIMGATKPHAAYFTETAALLGVAPDDCLMVGDDRTLDMSAADAGMKTYFVGGAPVPECDWSGSIGELPSLLRRLTR